VTNKKTEPEMTSLEKSHLIREYADDMKALDIETLDIREKTSMADFFVICTGTSDVHVKAICEKVAEKLREHGIKPYRQTERTGDGGGWVLFDYGDVVFHVMQEEKRQFYDLESFWESLPKDPNLSLQESAPTEPVDAS
jgi:ribosome-associated protein